MMTSQRRSPPTCGHSGVQLTRSAGVFHETLFFLHWMVVDINPSILQLLTGQFPYAHRTRDVQIIRDMQSNVKPCGPEDMAHATLGKFDPRIRTLLDACWSFAPAERPSMTDVQGQLDAIAADSSSHLSTDASN